MDGQIGINRTLKFALLFAIPILCASFCLIKDLLF